MAAHKTMERNMRRISTMKKVRNYDAEDDVGDAWNFPIGWNRSVDPSTGNATEPQDPRFLNNEIQTAKYTRLNFIPFNLLHQLSKGPNIYYLIICVLQMIEPISITAGSPTNAPPLIFLIVVSMIKDCFEDSRRRKADQQENNRITILIEPQGSNFNNSPNFSLLEEHPSVQKKKIEEQLIQKPVVSQIAWKQVKTGQIVKVNKNEFFPADLLLLCSSAPKNICFVETKNLDGETNLKHKIAPKELSKYRDEVELTQSFEGAMICEPPSDQIYRFEGIIKMANSHDRISLNSENLLLRGSSLRNTDWVIGVVVYTGHDTRIMRNSVNAKQKFSNLEKMITKSILIIMLIEALMCAVAAIVATVWNKIYAESTEVYLDLPVPDTTDGQWPWYAYLRNFSTTFFTWVLLFTNMVPISMLVTVEVVKFAQALFISWDISIYDTERDIPTRVQSSNLNEELGQISHIFSDKTGTLTSNVMQFRRFTAGMNAYGTMCEAVDNFEQSTSQASQKTGIAPYSNEFEEPSSLRDSQVADQIPNVEFEDPQFGIDFRDENQPNFANIEQMLLNLALNHAVVVESHHAPNELYTQNRPLAAQDMSRPPPSPQEMLLNPTGSGMTNLEPMSSLQISYNASSPDELALVNGARYLGVTYEGRDDYNNSLFKVNFKGCTLTYELLCSLEFSSARKRMTSVFRDPATGSITVMCKGADSVLLPLIRDQDSPQVRALVEQTVDHMNTFAKSGLRTLLIVQKAMNAEEFSQWNEQYQQALNSMVDRDAKVEECAALLERDFDLVGSTGLEDKLQDGVPDTIEMIRKAGIKLWVLTGDKIETAVNIGYACKLLDDQMNQYMIDAVRSAEVYKQLCIAENQQNLQMDTKKMGIIVSGEALTKIFQNDKVRPKFIEIAERADVVLACRVSPKQKAEIVQMVRNKDPSAITMAIGDGANDVNMITQAHVGIGLEGLEGMQAARASDYAISQFKYLRPLLFYHGREAYRRNATLAYYMFYKNNLFVMPQYWFGFASAFSGQVLYEPLIYQGYNIVFTAIPIMWFAVFDEEFKKGTLHNEPKHYWIGLSNHYFSFKLLTTTVLKGIANGLLIYLFIFESLNGNQVAGDGTNGSLWQSSAVLYAIVVINANLWVLQRTNSHTWVSTFWIVASILSYFFFWWFESLFPWSSYMYGTFGQTMGVGKVYLVIMLNVWQFIGTDMILSRWNARSLEKSQLNKLEAENRSKASVRQMIESFKESEFASEQQQVHSLEQNLLRIAQVKASRVSSEEEEELHSQRLLQSKQQQESIDREANSMGEKNPIMVQRRGTMGYAFSQDAPEEVEDVLSSSRGLTSDQDAGTDGEDGANGMANEIKSPYEQLNSRSAMP